MSVIQANFHRVISGTAKTDKAENCQWLNLSFKDVDNGSFTLTLFCESPEELLKALQPQGSAPLMSEVLDAMQGFRALVKGECPSLLDYEGGKDAEEFDAAIEKLSAIVAA